MQPIPNIPSAAYARPGFRPSKPIETTGYAALCFIIEVTVQRSEYSAKEVGPRYTLDVIRRACEQYYELPNGRTFQKTRKKEVVAARQITMYLACLNTKESLKSIGDYFDGKEHTTVIHARNTVIDQLELPFDNEIKSAVKAIEQQLITQGVLN